MFRHQQQTPCAHECPFLPRSRLPVRLCSRAEAGKSRQHAAVISGSPARSPWWHGLRLPADCVGPGWPALVFRIKGKPTWATFTSTTGRLSGTPSAGDTRRHRRLGDRRQEGRLAADVPHHRHGGRGQQAPPPSPVRRSPACPGHQLPVPSDRHRCVRRQLTYSIVGKPTWASFEASTGTLYGTPLALDAAPTTASRSASPTARPLPRSRRSRSPSLPRPSPTARRRSRVRRSPRRGRSSLRVPAHRGRCGQRHADLQHLQQAGVGDLRRESRHALRHAERCQCRLNRGRRHQRE